VGELHVEIGVEPGFSGGQRRVPGFELCEKVRVNLLEMDLELVLVRIQLCAVIDHVLISRIP